MVIMVPLPSALTWEGGMAAPVEASSECVQVDGPVKDQHDPAGDGRPGSIGLGGKDMQVTDRPGGHHPQRACQEDQQQEGRESPDRAAQFAVLPPGSFYYSF